MGDIHAIWRRLDRPGHDVVRLTRAAPGWVLEGFAAFHEHGPTGVRYVVRLADDFASVSGIVEGHRAGSAFRHRIERAGGRWSIDGRAAHGLEDAEHLDFGFTPATNLPQLLWADLAVGEAADIPAAWFDLDQPGLIRLPQRYHRVAEDRYHYSSPDTGYEATLELAASGFVRLYPEHWEMESGPVGR